MKRWIIILLSITIVTIIAGCNGTPNATVTFAPQNSDGTINSESPGPASTPEIDKDVTEKAGKLWEELTAGCWTTADERFAFFTFKEGVPAFYGGVWESDIYTKRAAANIVEMEEVEPDNYIITVRYAPVLNGQPANEDDMKEIIQTIEIDTADIDNDRKIRIKIDDDIIRQYAWGGASYDEAYDSVHQSNIATYEEVIALWSTLKGYWTGTNDRFIAFSFSDDGSIAKFCEGIWNVEGGRGFGDIERALSAITSENGDEIKLFLHYPAIENDFDSYVEIRINLYIDISQLEHNGCIRVKIEDDGEWIQYKFGGNTPEEAYEELY